MKINRLFGVFDSPARTRTAGCIYDLNGLSPTLNTMQGGYREPIILCPIKNKLRKFSVSECEKLMGWKNDWTKLGINAKGETYAIPNKKRLKMCGNGIASDVPKAILETLLGTKKEYKVLSTFSGVDGSCQKLSDNFKLIGLSEFDPDDKAQHASAVLKYHYPNVPNHSDFTKIDYATLPDFDILFTSSPCQDYSMAGKRLGINGLKGQLIHSIFQLVETKKVPFIIFENVKGLLTIANGESFQFILEEFSKLGYNVDFEICNSKNYGLAQSRERVFLICWKPELIDVNVQAKNNSSITMVEKFKKKLKNSNVQLTEIGIPLKNDAPSQVIRDILDENPSNEVYIPEKYNVKFNEFMSKPKDTKH